MVPILLSIAPIIPKWAHFGHGWIWISFILIVAAWSIGRGYKKHLTKSVLWLAGFGVIFLLGGTVFEEHLTLFTESAIFFIGGVLMTLAHWKNYRLEGRCSSRS